MDYKLANKPELLKMYENLLAEKAKVDQALQSKTDMNKIFTTGTQEKDAVILRLKTANAKLEDDMVKIQRAHQDVLADIQQQVNDKVSLITLSAKDALKDADFINEGMSNFIEEIEDLTELVDLQTKLMKRSSARLRSVYIDEKKGV